MSELRFEAIGPDEAEGLSELAYPLLREVYSYVPDDLLDEFLEQEQSSEGIRRQMAEGTVYEWIIADGVRAGYLAYGMEGDAMHLGKLYLFEGYRGRGIGSQAMDRVEGIARSRGARSIVLEVNERNAGAISLYSRKGFRESGKAGLMRIVMTRMLADGRSLPRLGPDVLLSRRGGGVLGHHSDQSVRSVRLLQIADVVFGQYGVHRTGHAVDMSGLRRPNHRRGGLHQEPGEGHLGHRDAHAVRDLGHPGHDPGVLVRRGVVLESGV